MSFTDVGAIVAFIAIVVLPGRPSTAVVAARPAFSRIPQSEPLQWSVGIAAARAAAAPTDHNEAALAKELSGANFGDWAAEYAESRSGRQTATWRNYFATSEVYSYRLEPILALQWAKRAAAACTPDVGCSEDNQLRYTEYVRALEGGIKSGIDPRINPSGFRQASEESLRVIRMPTIQ